MNFKTLAKTPTQTLLDAHKPADTSLAAWAARPDAQQQDEYRNPYTPLVGWANGSAQPPITKIAAASVVIGCSERDLALALHGSESQAEAIAKREAQRAQERNEERRAAYAASEEIRAQRAADQRQRRAAILAAKIADGTASRKTMAQVGLISEQDRIARAKAMKRAGKIREMDKACPIRIDGERRSLRGILQELRNMRTQCERMDRQLSRYAKVYSKPWHAAGFSSCAAAMAAGHAESIEWQRKQWQAITQRRRAKESKATGAGITRAEWVGIMVAWDYRCAYCGQHRSYVRNLSKRSDLEIEHVVPMPHGPNEVRNIVPACKPCNTSKGTKDVLVWAAKRGLHLDQRVADIHAAITAQATHAQG